MVYHGESVVYHRRLVVYHRWLVVYRRELVVNHRWLVVNQREGAVDLDGVAVSHKTVVVRRRGVAVDHAGPGVKQSRAVAMHARLVALLTGVALLYARAAVACFVGGESLCARRGNANANGRLPNPGTKRQRRSSGLGDDGLRPNGPPFFSPGHRPGSRGVGNTDAA